MSNRILILSCSSRKTASVDLLPAIKRYDGPSFKVLRKYLFHNQNKELQIFVLSAAYGLIPADYEIPFYDQVMTPSRSQELNESILSQFSQIIVNCDELCLFLSQLYLQAIIGWSDLVPPNLLVTIINGSQGIMLSKLKSWLWEEQQPDQGAKHIRASSPRRGFTTFHGVRLNTTGGELIDAFRRILANNSSDSSAYKIKDWYVKIDGSLVSPKWLINKLTGVPLSEFTSGEARRALHQLGIDSIQIRKHLNGNNSFEKNS